MTKLFLKLFSCVVMCALACACTGVNPEVQSYCDAVDNTTANIDKFHTTEDMIGYLDSAVQKIKVENPEAKLTDTDKEALKSSINNLLRAFFDRMVKLYHESLTNSQLEEISEGLEQGIRNTDISIDRCQTVGDIDLIGEI